MYCHDGGVIKLARRQLVGGSQMVYPLSCIGSSKAIAVPDYFMATINDQQFRGNNLMPRFFAAVSSCRRVSLLWRRKRCTRRRRAGRARMMPEVDVFLRPLLTLANIMVKLTADVLQDKILRIHLVQNFVPP
jgi:hypothetical protein